MPLGCLVTSKLETLASASSNCLICKLLATDASLKSGNRGASGLGSSMSALGRSSAGFEIYAPKATTEPTQTKTTVRMDSFMVQNSEVSDQKSDEVIVYLTSDL